MNFSALIFMAVHAAVLAYVIGCVKAQNTWEIKLQDVPIEEINVPSDYYAWKRQFENMDNRSDPTTLTIMSAFVMSVIYGSACGNFMTALLSGVISGIVAIVILSYGKFKAHSYTEAGINTMTSEIINSRMYAFISAYESSKKLGKEADAILIADAVLIIVLILIR